MTLKRYNLKRDFRKTPEPSGKVGKPKTGALRFVVQKHAASRLHYDFRLEWDGVLKSWAVPKGPSLDPAQKRLAVQVEDHPLDYGNFEGTIPKGEYGGGTVMLWDKGSWVSRKDPEQGFRQGKLEFQLKGKKLRGNWALIRMHGRFGDDGKNWLLIKEKDALASSGRDVLKADKSVKTGRAMKDIAEKSQKVWKSRKKRRGNFHLSLPPLARKAVLPSFVPPQLATLTDSVPNDDSWIHEIKFDGYRAIGRIKNGKAQIFTRKGLDWTRRFPEVAKALEALPVEEAMLDGEIVKLLPNGISSFQALQNALSEGDTDGLYYYLFDLLYLNGYDLTRAPLEERRQVLQKVLRESASDVLRFSEGLDKPYLEVYREACRQGLEGVLSKRRDQPYHSGRGRQWLKTKCHKEQEFVIVGFTNPQKSRQGFGALLLALHDARGELRYAGMVGTGFSHQSLMELHRKLRSLEQKETVVTVPAAVRRKGVHWVEPQLVAEVEFTEWTQDGLARHPSFKGLREDKSAKEVVLEKPVGKASTRSSPTKAAKKKVFSGEEETLKGVRLTHPEKILYPDLGLTKRDLADYYMMIADRILPYLKQRPISVVRCPDGSKKKCFFQKHILDSTPPQIQGVAVGKAGEGKYAMINDIQGLVALAQMGVLEIHPWGARSDDIEHPDIMIFDLDPGPSVDWKRIVETAKLMNWFLGELGLKAFLKTTGGKGLHIVVPLARKHSWDEVKDFSKAVAEKIVEQDSAHYTASLAKSKRNDKIFLDYLRNSRGATAVAPYSPRARPGAPVATPLFWEELSVKLKSDSFTIGNIFSRLKNLKKDPWVGFFSNKQTLNQKMRAKLQAA